MDMELHLDGVHVKRMRDWSLGWEFMSTSVSMMMSHEFGVMNDMHVGGQIMENAVLPSTLVCLERETLTTRTAQD